jgi:hypothetical protein
MSSARPAAGAGAASSSFRPRYQLANVFAIIGVLFGMWLCFEASSGRSMPYPDLLDPLKALGLFLFRTEWMLRVVFWLAVIAHVWEATIAIKFALKVTSSSSGSAAAAASVSRPLFVLFWFVQTALLGYPSLMLIKEQRRQQLQATKGNSQGKKAE